MATATQLNKDQLHQVELECNRTLAHAHDVVAQLWPQTTSAGGTSAFCPGVWDGLTCWPPTLANHTASQPCQRYFEGHYNLVGCQGNSATRYCTAAGKWFVHPQTQSAWTNYTDCIARPPGESELYTTTTENAIAAALSGVSDDVGVSPDELTSIYAATGRTPPPGGGDALWHEMRTNYLSHIQAISIMSSIGYLTSLVLLCIALCILIAVRRLKSPRNKLLINLSASFMLRATVIIMIRYLPLERWASDSDLNNMFHIRTELVTSDRNNATLTDVTFNVMYPNACLATDRTERHISSLWSLCKFGELVKHYSLLANYFWILMEGFYLNNILTFALFSEHSWLYAYICGGWLPPAVFVGIWATLKSVYAAKNDQCWHTEVYNDSHFWIIRGPITAAIFLSFIVFVNILRIVCTKLAGTREIDQSLQTPIKRRYAKLAKSFLCLIPLCGTHYVLTLTLADIKNPRTQVVWLFIEQLFTSFQGAFVALIYIFMSGDVRREIHRAITRRRSSKFKPPRSGGAQNGGLRKRPNNPRLNNNANANNQHQPLRVISSSPCVVNGHAVINFLQHQQQLNHQQPQTAVRFAASQRPCPDCVAFKMKPVTNKFHRFHPLLNKKSLTMSTFVPFNNNGGSPPPTPAAVVVVATHDKQQRQAFSIAKGTQSNGSTVHADGRDEATQNSLTVVAGNNRAQTCEHVSLTAVAAAAAVASPIPSTTGSNRGGSHHTSHSNGGVIAKKIKKYKQLRSRSTSNEQKSSGSNHSGGAGGGGGRISSGGSKTVSNSNNTPPILLRVADATSDIISNSSRRSWHSPSPSKSIRIEKSSHSNNVQEIDLADAAAVLLATARTSSSSNKISLLKIPKIGRQKHDGSDIEADGATTDRTDDEEDETDEEKIIGQRLIQNRHLYD